jgi:hypothetical protein
MDVCQTRLEREFDLDLICTAPSVVYQVAALLLYWPALLAALLLYSRVRPRPHLHCPLCRLPGWLLYCFTDLLLYSPALLAALLLYLRVRPRIRLA